MAKTSTMKHEPLRAVYPNKIGVYKDQQQITNTPIADRTVHSKARELRKLDFE